MQSSYISSKFIRFFTHAASNAAPCSYITKKDRYKLSENLHLPSVTELPVDFYIHRNRGTRSIRTLSLKSYVHRKLIGGITSVENGIPQFQFYQK